MANIFRDLGNYEKAMKYYEKCLIIFNELGDKFNKSACLLNIGIIYKNLGNYEKAMEYYKKSRLIMCFKLLS